MPVIIWINGGFGAGKTTLAQELHRRLPDTVVYDPEAAAARQPAGTLLLRSDKLTPAGLADEVLAAADLRS